MKKKRTWFWKIFWILTLLAMAGICVALSLLWQYLEQYQAALPTNLADRVLQAYQQGRTEELISYSSLLPESLRDPDDFRAYLKESVATDELFYYEVSTSKDTDKIYEIRTKKQKIARMTLSPTGNQMPGGFTEYAVAQLEEYPLYSYSFTVPSSVRLLLNGKPLDEKYRTGQQEIGKPFTELDTHYTVDTYEIEDLFYLTDVKAETDEGVVAAVEWDKPAHTVTCTIAPTAELQEQVQDFAQTFLKPYMVFATQYYGPRKPVLALLYPGSRFEELVKEYRNNWGHEYTKDRYEGLEISPVTVYSGQDFECRVTVDYIITVGRKEKSFPFDQVFYITNRNGEMQLLSMLPPAQEETPPENPEDPDAAENSAADTGAPET